MHQYIIPKIVHDVQWAAGQSHLAEPRLSCALQQGSLQAVVALFHDSVSVVSVLLLLGALASGQTPTVIQVQERLVHKAGGGPLLGRLLGCVALGLLKSVGNCQIEVMLTLAYGRHRGRRDDLVSARPDHGPRRPHEATRVQRAPGPLAGSVPAVS